MERCRFCQGELDPTTRICQECGRTEPGVSGTILPASPPETLTGRCPSCGRVLPLRARFCANCGQSFSGEISLIPLGPASASSPTIPAAPDAPQSGMPHVPTAPAGPQSGAFSVPSAPAGPQSGGSTVPTAPAGPQSGAPHVSGGPGGPQTGAPLAPSAPVSSQAGMPGSISTSSTVPGAPTGTSGSIPGAPGSAQPWASEGSSSGRLPAHSSRAGQMSSKTAARGGASGGAVAGKIITIVIVIVVVAVGGAAVAAATGHNPFSGSFPGASSNSGPGTGPAAAHDTPTPTVRTLTSQQTQSQTVNATGQKTKPGTHARGILTVHNPYAGTGPYTFPAGTVWNNDYDKSPNVQMMTDAAVFVPANVEGIGSAPMTVPAHVVQIGTIGNIPPQGWSHTYNISDAQRVDVFQDTSFTGGTDPQTYPVIRQSDIDSAANSLQAATRQSAIADLQSQLRPDEHLVGDPQCTFHTTSDHAAGDLAATVTVMVTAMCTATAST